MRGGERDSIPLMPLINLDATLATALAAAQQAVNSATSIPVLGGASVTVGSSSGSTVDPAKQPATERIHFRVGGLNGRAAALQMIKTQADEWYGNSDYVLTELMVIRDIEHGATTWDCTATCILTRK